MVIESVVGQFAGAVGTSAFAGGITGFLAKKIVKIAFAVVALQLAVFAYLDHRGILSMDWSRLNGALSGIEGFLAGLPDGVLALATTLPVGAGFLGGFLLGFHRA